MKIVLAPEVAINLESLVSQVSRQEFSGIGFVEIIDGDIHVYDILLLNIGSAGYSEIPADKLLQAVQGRPDKDNIRLWFHRHPVEGWSATDLNTILTAPLGGIPELVRWSASIVRTPTRWIGRVDNHLTRTHVVAEVVPNIDLGLLLQTRAMLGEYWEQIETQIHVIPMSDLEEDEDMILLPFRQPALFQVDEIDDWLDASYADDAEQGWGQCTDEMHTVSNQREEAV